MSTVLVALSLVACGNNSTASSEDNNDSDLLQEDHSSDELESEDTLYEEGELDEEDESEDILYEMEEDETEELDSVDFGELRSEAKQASQRLAADDVIAAIGDDGEVLVSGYADVTFYESGGVECEFEIIAIEVMGTCVYGLTENGTVVSTSASGTSTTLEWTDIVQIDAGDNSLLVGLKSDGTVVSTYSSLSAYSGISEWTDIIDVAAGSDQIVGLKSDGTVVAIGDEGISGIESWTDIVDVAAGNRYTLGLKSDGTVVAGGSDVSGSDVSEWENIVSIEANYNHSVGLKSDGTIESTGNESKYDNKIEGNDFSVAAEEWTDIIGMAIGDDFVVGLKSDGTYISSGTSIGLENFNLGSYENETELYITHEQAAINKKSISMDSNHIVAITSDGNVVSAGDNDHGQCDTEDWSDVIQVVAEQGVTAALKSDGTVYFAGEYKTDGFYTSFYTYLEVAVKTIDINSGPSLVYITENGTTNRSGSGKETDYIEVVASNDVFYLKSDGTVAGKALSDYPGTNEWTDIVELAAGLNHLVGLKSNGTVVAAGRDTYGQCDVEEWTDIVSIVAGDYCTIGLKSNGTLVVTGYSDGNEMNVLGWTDIIAISEGTIGLKSDGTVVTTETGYDEIDDWTDIGFEIE